MAFQGNGATITFATSGWTGEVIEMTRTTQSREVLDTTVLTDTTARSFTEGEAVDYGGWRIRYYTDFGSPPPIAAEPETITITAPLLAGQSVAANETGTGFIFTADEGALAINGLMEGEFEIKWTDQPTRNAAT